MLVKLHPFLSSEAAYSKGEKYDGCRLQFSCKQPDPYVANNHEWYSYYSFLRYLMYKKPNASDDSRIIHKNKKQMYQLKKSLTSVTIVEISLANVELRESQEFVFSSNSLNKRGCARAKWQTAFPVIIVQKLKRSISFTFTVASRFMGSVSSLADRWAVWRARGYVQLSVDLAF